MSERDLGRNWKRTDNNFRQNSDDKYDNTRRQRSPSSSKSRKFSNSRSRSKSIKAGNSRSISRSNSFHSDKEHSPGNKNVNTVHQKGPAMNFLIFLSKYIESSITCGNNNIKKIEDQVGDVKIFFDDQYKIPDLNGSVMQVKADDIKKRKEATQLVLEYIVKNNLDEPEEEGKKHSDKISILVLVPNGLVSMIIGTKGRQISHLIHDSGANIVVNQPIYKMNHRTVTISGKPNNVAIAIMMIYNIMEERYYEVQKVELECKPLNVTTTQTHIKFVLHEEVVNYISSKKPSFVNNIKDNCEVSVQIYQDKKNRQLERRDYVLSLKGTIRNVQDAILLLIKKIQAYIRSTYDGRDSFQMKMLINKVFVTKLIGAGGCMIQEIANFSKGASIKILSSRKDEERSSTNDIMVSIAGSLGAIQDATCIIIEQMECFKKGGPVLKSGKNLNQNIAHQFINSIFCDANRKEDEEPHCYTLKERFLSKKRPRSGSRSRSRSRSRSKSHHHHEEKERTRKHREDPKENKSNDNHHQSNYDGKDPSNNISYDEKGTLKITNDIIVPDYLVSLLIGKNGECIRGIMNKSNSMITFQKEYNDDSKINTTDGVLGRICSIKGTPQQNALAIQLISEMIIKLESSLNGIRKEN